MSNSSTPGVNPSVLRGAMTACRGTFQQAQLELLGRGHTSRGLLPFTKRVLLVVRPFGLAAVELACRNDLLRRHPRERYPDAGRLIRTSLYKQESGVLSFSVRSRNPWPD